MQCCPKLFSKTKKGSKAMIEYVTLAKRLSSFASLWQIWHFAQAINKLRKGVIRKIMRVFKTYMHCKCFDTWGQSISMMSCQFS